MKIRAILILAFTISASILLAGCNNTPAADDGDIAASDTTAQPVPGGTLKKDKANVGKAGGTFDEKEAVSMEEPSEDQEVPGKEIQGRNAIEKNGQKLSAYEKLFQDGPLPVQDVNELWGYIDSTGEYLIDPVFIQAEPFSNEGIAVVQDAESGLYGYIDVSGQYKVLPQFKNADSFCDGLAIVATEEGYGYMDTSGKLVIPAKFAKAYNFSEGLARVMDKQTGLNGYIDLNGEYVIYPSYRSGSSFKEGVAFVYTVINDEVTGALIDKNGNLLTEFLYREKLGSFGSDSSGLLCVEEKSFGYSFINTKGEVVLPKDGSYYEKAYDFSEGYAAVKDPATSLWGYVDLNGNWVIPPKYELAESFSEGYACAREENGRIGYINVTGEWAILPEYTSCSDRVRKGRVAVTAGDMSSVMTENLCLNQLLDISGNVILEVDNNLSINDGFSDDIVAIRNNSNDKYGFMDLDGNIIFDYILDYAYSFSSDNSYAKAQYQGLWGILDSNGNWMIPAKFKTI